MMGLLHPPILATFVKRPYIQAFSNILDFLGIFRIFLQLFLIALLRSVLAAGRYILCYHYFHPCFSVLITISILWMLECLEQDDLFNDLVFKRG